MTEHSTKGFGADSSATRQMALLLMTLFVVLSTTAESELITGEFCQFETFNVTCANNDVILMHSSLYGRFRLGRCVKQGYGVIDCKEDVLALTDYRCSGKRHCKFVVSDISLQGIQPCNEFTSNLEVSYTCVQVDDVVSSGCVSLKRKSIQSEFIGYLTQSYLPDRTISSLECGWILEAEIGHRIQIDLYYFAQVVPADRPIHATSGGNDVPFLCRRLAKIRDKQSGKETNICTTKERVRNVFKSDSHIVEIILTGRQESSHDPHFLFKYEVTGCRTPTFPGTHVVMTSERTSDVVCNLTNQRWTLTCIENSWTGGVGDCTEAIVHSGDSMGAWSTLNYEWKSAKGLTLVVGLGIVLGIAVGMLMLAIAACLIRGEHVCLPRQEPCSELEMVEDGGQLVDQIDGSQWICADHGHCDKELFSSDIWRVNDQRQSPALAGVTPVTGVDRHSTSGYQTFYADCSLSSQISDTCPVTLVRESRCPGGGGAPGSRHCYDSPGI